MKGEILAINNENMNEEQAKELISNVFNGVSAMGCSGGK